MGRDGWMDISLQSVRSAIIDKLMKGLNMCTLLYLKWITNKDLLYSTGNSAECYVAAWMGGEFGGEWIHGYIWLSSFLFT